MLTIVVGIIIIKVYIVERFIHKKMFLSFVFVVIIVVYFNCSIS